jgi:periplasmic divalent cation tolerance protein
VEEADDVAAIFKARADKAEALIARLSELHSYEVPAIVICPVESAWPAIEAEG